MTDTDPKTVEEVVVDILNAETDTDSDEIVEQFAADGGDVLELINTMMIEIGTST